MITLIRSDKPSKTGDALSVLLSLAPTTKDALVNWTGGRTPEELDGLPVLNAHARTDKLAQLVRLTLKGVNTPEWSHTPKEGWLGRSLFHQQGRDFTHPVRPAFWVKRVHADDEWRLHFIRTKAGNLRLVRSGLKLPRQRDFHPWVRNHRLGWKISYIGGAPQYVVSEARKAMEALQLDFAAVDVLHSIQAEHVVHVLEVNTCPGLDTGTLELYVDNLVERFK